MAELHPELAKATAQTALQFLASFDGEDFGILREDRPGPHDRRHLAIALDYIQELGAMVLNLADRVPHNALAQADAACGVSPGAECCTSNGNTENNLQKNRTNSAGECDGL